MKLKPGDPSDPYIAGRTPDQRALLEALRGLIRKAVPDAVDAIGHRLGEHRAVAYSGREASAVPIRASADGRARGARALSVVPLRARARRSGAPV